MIRTHTSLLSAALATACLLATACAEESTGDPWGYNALWLDLEMLPEGKWQPADSQPFARYGSNQQWLGALGDKVYYGRAVAPGRWAVIGGSGQGDWHEFTGLNEHLAERTGKLEAIYGLDGAWFVDGQHDTTLYRPVRDLGNWQEASVTIRTAVNTDHRLYATLETPERGAPLAVYTGGPDWRRIRESVREFWVAGEVIHTDKHYSTDGGDSWQEYGAVARPSFREESRQLPKVDGDFWAIAGADSRLQRSADGLDWQVADEQPPGFPIDVAGHGGELFVLADASDGPEQTIYRRDGGAWRVVAVPQAVTPRQLEATSDALYAPAENGGVWRYEAASESMRPQHMPAGEPNLAVGDELLVASAVGRADIAVRERGDPDNPWRYLFHRRDEGPTTGCLTVDDRVLISEHADGESPTLRFNTVDAAGSLEPWFASDRFASVFDLVRHDGRYWIGGRRQGVAALDSDRNIDSGVEPLTPADFDQSRHADLVSAGDSLWAVYASDDIVRVHRRTDGGWRRLETGLPDQFGRGENGEGLERSAELEAIGDIPILAVDEHTDAHRKTHLFGWHRNQGRWVQVAPAFGWSERSGLDGPTLHAAGRALLLVSRRGIFQLDPQADEWSRVGALDRLALTSDLSSDDGELWLTRTGRGIWRYRAE